MKARLRNTTEVSGCAAPRTLPIAANPHLIHHPFTPCDKLRQSCSGRSSGRKRLMLRTICDEAVEAGFPPVARSPGGRPVKRDERKWNPRTNAPGPRVFFCVPAAHCSRCALFALRNSNALRRFPWQSIRWVTWRTMRHAGARTYLVLLPSGARISCSLLRQAKCKNKVALQHVKLLRSGMENGRVIAAQDRGPHD